jgi:hypothetical protein
MLRVIKFRRGTGEQTPELHLKKAETRREAWVPEAAFHAGSRRIGQRLDRNARDGSRVNRARRSDIDGRFGRDFTTGVMFAR